jgi:hypothetical protein
MKFGEAFREVELFFYKIVTVGSRTPFWCDSHPWLCFCCGRLRTWIRGHVKDFRHFSGCSVVADRWGTFWLFRAKDFSPPYTMFLGQETIIVGADGVIRRKRGRMPIFYKWGKDFNTLEIIPISLCPNMDLLTTPTTLP